MALSMPRWLQKLLQRPRVARWLRQNWGPAVTGLAVTAYVEAEARYGFSEQAQALTGYLAPFGIAGPPVGVVAALMTYITTHLVARVLRSREKGPTDEP